MPPVEERCTHLPPLCKGRCRGAIPRERRDGGVVARSAVPCHIRRFRARPKPPRFRRVRAVPIRDFCAVPIRDFSLDICRNSHYNKQALRGVAQLVARMVRDHEAASSSLATPTKQKARICYEFGLISFYLLCFLLKTSRSPACLFVFPHIFPHNNTKKA